MNTTFSPKRFGYLLREMIVEKRIFFLGLFVALFAFHLIIGFTLGYPDFRGAIAVTCSLVGTFVIALFLTKRFEKSAIGIRHFMLPTSQLEKWLSVLVFYIGFILIYNVLLKIGDVILLSAMKLQIESLKLDSLRETQALEKLTPYTFWNDSNRAAILISTFLASWFLTVSTYFGKNKMVLALFAGIGSVFILFMVNWGINYMTFGIPSELSQPTPFANSNFEFTNDKLELRNNIELEVDQSKKLVIRYIAPIMTIFLFVIYYFRLKETET